MWENLHDIDMIKIVGGGFFLQPSLAAFSFKKQPFNSFFLWTSSIQKPVGIFRNVAAWSDFLGHLGLYNGNLKTSHVN